MYKMKKTPTYLVDNFIIHHCDKISQYIYLRKKVICVFSDALGLPQESRWSLTTVGIIHCAVIEPVT